ncbi:MAG TPA: response regulator [Candidatus Binatia bacterium]|nr:response regulator [Candidatus Binatia bacterium]
MSAKILVIDDEEEVINFAAYYLGNTDFEIISAQTGVSGLHAARRHLPDIILLDLSLPDIDGFHVCEILRKQPSTAKIQIVLVTAMAGEIAQSNVVVSGADHFLTKPFSREDLTACVEEALRAREARLETEGAAPEYARA